MNIPMRSPTHGNGTLTTNHAMSSHGDPVFVVRGQAYGREDLPEPLEWDAKHSAEITRVRRNHPEWRSKIMDRRSLTSAENARRAGPTVLVGARLPADLVARLDQLDGTRTEHLERALRAYLDEDE